MAIGWHFLYEGREKYDSTKKTGAKPFSAESYLRNATGPLARYYRGIVPDVNSLAKLDAARLKAAWAEDVKRIEERYGYDEKQKADAETALHKAEADADAYFLDKDFLENRRKYIHELVEVQSTERNRNALSYELERAVERRKDLNTERQKLVQELDAIGGALREAVLKLATDSQRQTAGPYPAQRWKKLAIPWGSSTVTTPIKIPEWNSLQWVDHLTIYGLMAMGVGLILGLFTRLSALAGAVFLAQIYLSMPPWPGLPASPLAEGHYLIVNKNLIEMLACLALVFLPTGRWIGLDALLFGWIGRRRGDSDDEPDRRLDRRNRASS
jgi:uncharacterized membrane protein YphA (DoxX/SURF4 family)